MFYRIIRFLQDFFSVSPKEARGIAGLLLMSVMVLLFPVFLKRYLFHRSQQEITEERIFLDSLLRAVSYDNKNRSSAGKEPEPLQEFVELKDFNPNTATADEMTNLGIPGFIARRIINYRQKGGIFRRKEDLRRIYDFPEDLYQKLAPYIRLSGEQAKDSGTAGGYKPAPAGSGDNGYGQGKKKPTAFEAGHPQVVIVPFDINKADTTQLKRLKGIGSGRARIIINYRNALGGFHSGSQYPEIYGLDTLALAELKRYARVLSLPRKIPVNTVSREELLMHPYARKHRRLSEAIIRYRDQHGPYRSREDLEKVINITPGFLDQMIPYITFD